jgi:hypothetical protein
MVSESLPHRSESDRRKLSDLKDHRYPSSQSGVVTLAGLVFVLLLNDFVLKDAFHNYLTGASLVNSGTS